MEPPSKKRKLGSVRAAPQALQEELNVINKEITELESKISTEAAEFKKVRMAMMTGIISFEGIKAQDKIEMLTKKLNDLRAMRESALSRMDQAIQDSICKEQGAAVKSELGEYCKQGCKNRIFDSASSADICVDCGAIYDHRLDNNLSNFAYEDVHFDMPRRRGGGYKPTNHFAEILAQFQGKRRSCAPPHVVEMVKSHCERYSIPPHKITYVVVRSILKQKQQDAIMTFKWSKEKPKDSFYKYTDYYKHSPEIAWRLSGIPPPYMTPSQQDRIIAQFPRVVAAYRTSPRYLSRKANRHGRKKEEPNILNNFFILFKLCQLFGYDEFLPYIPLPKSLANIEDCDQFGWKHISKVNGYAYIPTK